MRPSTPFSRDRASITETTARTEPSSRRDRETPPQQSTIYDSLNTMGARITTETELLNAIRTADRATIAELETWYKRTRPTMTADGQIRIGNAIADRFRELGGIDKNAQAAALWAAQVREFVDRFGDAVYRRDGDPGVRKFFLDGIPPAPVDDALGAGIRDTVLAIAGIAAGALVLYGLSAKAIEKI